MTLTDTYQSMITSGKLLTDSKQLALIRHLQDFLEKHESTRKSLFRLLRGSKPSFQGLYIHGPVGRGKTMLMDLLFYHIRNKNKQRTHFHSFMRDVHKQLKLLRGTKQSTDHLIKKLASQIAKETAWLCFDEFVVEDIADAMILGRLFEQLFNEGVIIVATSNTEPDSLYKGGLQRELFLPFIAILKKKMKVLSLSGPRDYRMDRLQGKPVYLTPSNAKTGKELRRMFHLLSDDQVQTFIILEHQGRKVVVPESGHGVAYFHFNDLCDKAYGASDYLLIARAFKTILIENIPALSDANSDQAKRFITLIDVLYDNRIHLICQAAAPPQKLYTKGKLAKQFERTASRLMEMQSLDYVSGHFSQRK